MHTKRDLTKQRIFCLCLATVFFTCTGCSEIDKSEHDTDGSGYLFSVSILGNPASLDPQLATDSSSLTVIENMYEGLVELDEYGNPLLAVADNYFVSDDGKTYTFNLHNNRYWYFDTDGDDEIQEDEVTPLTAYDYEYAFQRIFNPETQSPYADTFQCLQNAKAILNGSKSYTEIGVKALGEYQIQFTLDYTDEQFLQLLASTAAYPCNEEFFLSTKGRYGLDQESVESCGAFYMRLWFYDEYGSDNLIYLRRNDANTEARKVYPTDVTIHIRRSEETVKEDFTGDNSDILLSSLYDETYMDSEDYTVSSSCCSTLGLIFNKENETFQNENIRQALSLSLDRSTLGKGAKDLVAAYGIIPKDVHLNGNYYRNLVDDTTLGIEYDTDQAKSLFNKGLRTLNLGSIDSINLLVCEEQVDEEYLHDITQAWQENLGFYAGLEIVNKKEYDERLASGDYTIAIYGVSPMEDDPSSLLEQFDGNANAFGFSDASVSALLDNVDTLTSVNALQAQYANIESAIIDTYDFIPIFYKTKYLITTSENEDIRYDFFTGALNFRDAKHYE